MSLLNSNYPKVHVTTQEPVTRDGKLVFNISVTVDLANTNDTDSVSTVSNDFVSIAPDMLQEDVRVEVTESDGIRSRTTFTPLPNNMSRRHTRFEECDAHENGDYDTRKLKNDLKHWRVSAVRPDSLLVYPDNEFSVFRGRHKTFPDKIETGMLYHRPLYFSDQYGGYWINKNSEIARLIYQNSEDEKGQRSQVPNLCVNEAPSKLQGDLESWKVMQETADRLLVRNTNPNSKWFGSGASRSTHKQQLAYSQGNGGFWINKNSVLAKMIRKTNAQEKAHTGSFIEDVINNWYVVFELSGSKDSALIRPNKNSRYANRPTVIDTEGAYHRPIYYHSSDDGYWVSKGNHLFQCASDNVGLLNQQDISRIRTISQNLKSN